MSRNILNLAHTRNRRARLLQDLLHQLRDILSATVSISAARNNPFRLASLHIQLADSYRGSPMLRSAWFSTLAQIYAADSWFVFGQGCRRFFVVFFFNDARAVYICRFAEAAVCEAHCVAVIARQLSLQGNKKTAARI